MSRITDSQIDDAKDAEGVERFESPHGVEELLRAREEAQGVEVFSDPDAAAPADTVAAGSPGEERLSAAALELSEEDNGYDRSAGDH